MNVLTMDAEDWKKGFEQALETIGVEGKVHYAKSDSITYLYKESSYTPRLTTVVVSLPKQTVEESTIGDDLFLKVIERLRNPANVGEVILCFKTPTFRQSHDYHMFIQVSYTVHTS